MLRRLRRKLSKKFHHQYPIEQEIAQAYEDGQPFSPSWQTVFSLFDDKHPEFKRFHEALHAQDHSMAMKAIHLYYRDRKTPVTFNSPIQFEALSQRFKKNPKRWKSFIEQTIPYLEDQIPLGEEQPHHYPKLIDWHTDLEGKSWLRAPILELQEFFDRKLHLNSGHTQADIQRAWALNSLTHLIDLSRVYWLTSNESYAGEYLVHTHSWIKANQCLIGINWLDLHNICYRSLSLALSLPLILHSKQCTPKLFVHQLNSILLHAASLAHAMRYRIDENNPHHHLEAFQICLTLLFLGKLFPEFIPLRRWYHAAKQKIQEFFPLQTDQIHASNNLWSHYSLCEQSLLLALLYQRNDQEVPPPLFEITRQVLEPIKAMVHCDLSLPDIGPPSPFRLLARGQNHHEWSQNLLALAAIVTADSQFQGMSPHFRDELFWWLGPNADIVFDNRHGELRLNDFKHYPELGLQCARLGWGEESSSLHFRSRPEKSLASQISRAPAPPVYHDDILSIALTVNAIPFITEGGTLSAKSRLNGPLGDSLFHSTCCLQGEKKPWLLDDPSPLPSPHSYARKTAEGILLSSSRLAHLSAHGPMTITRNILVLAQEKQIVIQDLLLGEEKGTYFNSFLIPHEIEVLMRGDMGCMLRKKRERLRLVPLSQGRVRYQFLPVQENSSNYRGIGEYQKEPCHIVRYHSPFRTPYSFYYFLCWSKEDVPTPRIQDLEKLFERALKK